MRKIFLSFAYEDRLQVQGFKLLRFSKNIDINFFDSSLLTQVESQDRDYIKRCIREKMKNTSVTVVLIGVDTHKSSWVGWEVEESIRQKKGILGIRLKGQFESKIPESMSSDTVLVGNWNPDNCQNWIEQAAEKVGK